ncbi:MAG TPA: lamin tail domain-containing protein [Candidatus Paceibacterota bacterium]|nr:lamin tail domain-containing protein [Candidatus Paceibacterota bacterium]
MKLARLALTLLMIAPSVALAQVRINEVAWMGTAENANDEWIELFNDGTDDVSLDGWTLSDGDTLSVTLSGVLFAGAYGVLERTDDDTVPGVSAFLIYTGALGNDGRTLTLSRADGSTEDRVVGGDAWTNIGGDNETKATAQRTASGWTTAAPTPGERNEAEEVAAAPEPEPEVTLSRSRGSGGGTTAPRAQKPVRPAPPPELSLGLDAPKTAYVGQPVSFTANATGLPKPILDSLVYTWNFGDTDAGAGRTVTHTYAYPGEYVAVVDAAYGKHDEMMRKDVTVLPVSLSLSRTASGDIELKNTASYEEDLGGFSLGGFTFPKYSFVKGKGTLIVPTAKVGTRGPVSLRDTRGVAIASLSTSPQRSFITKANARISEPIAEANLEVVAPASTTVIRIGNATTEEKLGFFARFYSMLFGS